MNPYFVIILGLLPAILLFAFIYFKDRHQPEPAGKLLSAFALGVVSILPVFIYGILVSIFTALLGGYGGLYEALFNAFVMAAIPEEASKLLMLWLVLRKNRYFDEKLDGIVYGACVALGFAAFENVLYLFGNVDTLYEVATTRALLAVPMHFCCGVIMGYYVSMAKFYPYRRNMNFALAFIVPMAIHGIYDALLMMMPVIPVLNLLLFGGVIAFSFFVWKRALSYIRQHKLRDELDKDVECEKL